MKKLLIIIFFILNPIIIIILSSISLLMYPIDKNGNFTRKLVKFYVKTNSAMTGMKVSSIGYENFDASKNYFVLANFNEITDIFAMLYSFPSTNILCILRIHNFFIPFIGIVFRRSLYIKFSIRKVSLFISSTIKMLNEGYSILHFPSGYSDLLKSDFIYSNFIKIYKNSSCDILPVKIIHNIDTSNHITIEYKKPISGKYNDKDLKYKLVESIKN